MNATETASPKQRKPRPKPERRIRVIEQPAPDTDGWGAIEISQTTATRRTTRTETTVYLIRFIPSEFGNGSLGFEVEKIDADLAAVETYHVHLSDRPEDRACDCKGCSRHGHCKHLEGLEALRRAGKLLPVAHREPQLTERFAAETI